VIPIETCPILHPDLGGLLADLDAVKGDAGRIVLRAGIGTGERMIIFEETVPPPGYRPDANASVIVRDQGGSRLMTGRAHLHEQVAGFRFRIAPDGFFQVSTAGAGALVEEVLLRLPRRPLGTVLDLYAGGGLFSMPIAQRAERVIAVESHPPTSEDARLNAASAGLNNIENLSMDVAAFLERGHGPIDVVLLDPPRRGCGPAVAGRIAALEPSHIVYISCDPATLSRDAAALAGHGFRPVDIRPVDLFPQTFHIETVAHFRPFTSAAPENNA